MDSILNSIKKMLGVEESDTAFDTDLVIHINSALMILTQLGVGPLEGFSITGVDELWSQFLSDQTKMAGVKTYVYLKTRMVFDPPSTSFVIDAFDNQIQEYEFRLLVQAEPPTTPTTPEEV